MTTQCRPLIEVLAEIPDFRHRQGKRHPLSAILALACVAMLCGYRSYSAIAEWGRNYGPQIAQALGFTHPKTPCASTLHRIFRRLNRNLIEAKLGQWAESLLAAKPAPEGEEEAIALDGKALRGSRKQGAPGSHLLSALSHRLGLTLAQRAVDDKTNEIPVILEVLRELVLEISQDPSASRSAIVFLLLGNSLTTLLEQNPLPQQARTQSLISHALAMAI